MNTNHNVFEILLSTGELFWLARAMKIAHLPLPDDPYRGWLVDEIEHDLNSGCESLQARSLIERKSAEEWQIDDVLFAAVRWMAASTRCVIFLSRGAGGEPVQIITYLSEAGLLFAEWNAKQIRVLLFKELSSLMDYLLPLIGIANQNSATPAVRLLQAEAVKKWVESGVQDPVLNGIDFITSLTKVEWFQQKPRLTKQYLLVGNSNALWAADIPTNKDGEFRFKSYPSTEGRKLISVLLS